MISYRRGDILSDRVDALVNTVNTEGVSGKGIALQFKMRFPQNYETYRRAAKRGEVQLGKVFPVWIGALDGPQWIINFPTKGHWRSRSRLDEIEAGLEDLAKVISELNIRSIAVPPLGCGNGGLEWRDVKPVIEDKLATLDNVDVHIFSPDGAPSPAEMIVSTRKPRMSMGRSTMIAVLEDYIRAAQEGATKLVVQKLAYLLQEAGTPLKLSFAPAPYGPYAERVNFVLQDMEGHYTVGYGDRTQATSIQLKEGAVREAQEFLQNREELKAAVERVAAVIDGLESPYGMELLATTHFVATHYEPPAHQADEAIRMVQEWSERKGRMFTDAHIKLAWDRLTDQGWLPMTPEVATPTR